MTGHIRVVSRQTSNDEAFARKYWGPCTFDEARAWLSVRQYTITTEDAGKYLQARSRKEGQPTYADATFCVFTPNELFGEAVERI